MTKQELEILERAFQEEVDSAINGGLGLLQTKSKVAKRLATQGFLEDVNEVLLVKPPITVAGYRLTHLGRMVYCEQCG